MGMRRTTIMADADLLDELRKIARDEGISLGEVIRQGLEWRVHTRRRIPSFIGKVASPGKPRDTASRDEEIILEYVKEKDARRRDARR
jgi:hypothetical protein